MAFFVLKYLFLYFSIVLSIVTICANAETTFDQFYQPLWGAPGHLQLINNEAQVQLLLDEKSGGAGFRSKNVYSSGAVRFRIKIPLQKSPGGVITAFFLTNAPLGSNNVNHDELDFEFRGSTGVLQSNVFVNDLGHREELVKLWFDPSRDFHLYEIDWNQKQAVFSVDDRPVRIFNTGPGFFSKSFRVEASLWSGAWAGPIDWSQEPFTAQFTGFSIKTSSNPMISPAQKEQHEEIRRKYLIWDYCTSDKSRNHSECAK